MNRALRWYDLFTINIYFLALTTLSQTMTPLVVPLLVQQFVGEAQQGAFYGTTRLWSLMVALLVQALMGMLSDRSTLPWGRRRPFILIGTLASIVFIILIGFTAGMEGMSGFWALFILLIFLQISSNTAQAAVQGLIPDLVPEVKRGLYSGVKSLLEVPIPLILVAFTIGKLIAAGQMWSALFVAIGIIVFSMLVTMFAPETPQKEPPLPFDWKPFLRLVAMTAVFTLIILGSGWVVKQVGQNLGAVSQGALLSIMGFLGAVAMAITVVVGIILSVRISLGVEAQKNPSFTWWVVNRLSYLVGSTNLASFVVYFLQGKLGLAREQAAGPASQLIMFIGLFILVLSIPSGWLADKFGRKPLVIFSGILAAAGTIVLIFAPNLTVIYIGGVIVGVATGVFFTANWALGTEIVPQEEAGKYLGISNLAGAGAGAVGAYIGGPIADLITKSIPDIPGIGYILLFAIYAALFLFSIFAVTRVKTRSS